MIQWGRFIVVVIVQFDFGVSIPDSPNTPNWTIWWITNSTSRGGLNASKLTRKAFSLGVTLKWTCKLASVWQGRGSHSSGLSCQEDLTDHSTHLEKTGNARWWRHFFKPLRQLWADRVGTHCVHPVRLGLGSLALESVGSSSHFPQRKSKLWKICPTEGYWCGDKAVRSVWECHWQPS